MRYVSTIVALLGSVVFIGCSDLPSPTRPTSELAPATAPSGTATFAALSASTSTNVLTIPASVRLSAATRARIEACVGEPVTIVGEGLLVIHETTLPNGSQLVVVHANPQGAIAVGSSSGTQYRIGASDTLAQFVTPSGGFVGTFTADLHVIGPGGAGGFFGHIILHITVTPDGVVTADIEIVDIQCA